MTLVPWKNDKSLIWDATCPDPLAQSYSAASGTGAVAARAETRKLTNYDSLAPRHTIVPVAIESLGVIGPISIAFLKVLRRRIRQCSGEVKAHQYLLQRLSVAVQRGNAISVLSSVAELSGLDIFSL